MPETDYSVRTFKGGYDDNLTYLVTCMRTGNQFLVDAAVPLKQIDSYMSKKGLIALFIKGLEISFSGMLYSHLF